MRKTISVCTAAQLQKRHCINLLHKATTTGSFNFSNFQTFDPNFLCCLVIPSPLKILPILVCVTNQATDIQGVQVVGWHSAAITPEKIDTGSGLHLNWRC